MGLGDKSPTSTTSPIYFFVPHLDADTPGFESLTRDSQYNWVNSERLSRDPAFQFTGIGEENITVEGKMYPYHFGGLNTIKLLREAGARGKPLALVRFYPLTDPNGYGGDTLGNYVIKRVRTIETKIGRDAIARKIDFTLELAKYGDDLATPAVENDLFVNQQVDNANIQPDRT
jgi:phage protein U